MSDDPFFKLLKDGYSYNKPTTVTKEKKIDDYYAHFKGNLSTDKASIEKKAEDTERFQKEKKTITDFFASLKRTVPTGNNPAPTTASSHNYSNISPGGLDIFKSRITPDNYQKQQILKDVYHNNVNHVYNTEVLPRLEAASMPRLKVTNIEDMMDLKKGPIELEIEPEFQDFRSKPKVTLLEGAPNVIEDVVYDDSVTDEIEDVDYENMQNYEYNGSSPERTPPKSPQMEEIQVPKHHLDLYAFANGKQRQPTLVELMKSSKKIQKKTNGDDDTFNKMRDKYIDSSLKAPQGNGQRRSPSPQPIRPPPGPTREEMLEKLKQEMKQKGAEERAKAKAKEDEIKRKMMIAKKENEERMKAYKRRMQEDAETRLASLISSGGQMYSGADVMNVNQAINKQRKNVDGLLKFLLGYRYYEQDLSALPTPSVPNDFEDFAHYQSCFQPLLMKEYISSISASLATIKRQKGSSKYVRCLMRVCNKIGEMDDDYSMIELKESKGENDDDQPMISFQNKNVNEVFDLKFANNYLVLISFSKEVDLDKINKDDYRNGFSIVGYMSSSEKANIQEIPKAATIINYVNMRRFLKKEWNVCYVRPIEKITTYIREYISLNCFIYSDVNKYIYNPRGVSNIVNTDNNVFYQKFFDTIKPKYNKGQLESIKDVCLSENGICLLQGPPGTGKTHTLVGIVSGIYHYLKTSSATHRRYIMICTPSNAAVDEIILRIQTNGLFGENGEIIRPNVVRVGILDKEPHELVKKCALENLAQERMNIGKGKSAGKDEATVNEIRDEIAKVSRKIDILKQAPDVDKKSLDLLYEKKRTLHAKYQDYKLTQVGEKEKYSQVVQSILYSADIICCTLTSAGSEKLDRFRDYIEAIIVDEASQCTEPSNIIPLQYSPKKLILIGDPKQLPATTFSPDSVTTKFSRSLFERIMDCGVQAFFLYEQYRMISNIRKFPSKAFYENRLVDAKSVEQRAFPPYLSNFENKNVLFLDLKFSKETLADHSYFNKAEINVCSTILETLIKKLNVGGQTMKHKLGLISPYKKQVNMLNENLREKHGMKYRDWVAVNTVDAFQGQEKDVILFSAVRSNQDLAKGGSDKNLIGFLSDVRRLNVAITRPRFVLIIVGNSSTLATNETWRDFIESVAQDKGFISISMEQEVEKVMRVMFRNEELPPYLTKSPDLPALTPRKPKKDPAGGDDSHLYAPSSSAKNSVSTASTVSGITKGGSVDNKDGRNIYVKKDSMKKESAIKRKPATRDIVQEGDDNVEVIEKKLKTESASRKPTVEKREEKKDDYMGGLSSLFGGGGGTGGKTGGSMVVEEDKPKTSSSELGGLSSLFGGGSKPKSSPTEGGLSSLFPKKPSETKTSKAKEPQDNSDSLLHRLFKF